MAIKITPYQKNAGGTLDEYKFASTGSIVDLNGYMPYDDSELNNIPDITEADTVNTAVKKLDGKTRLLDSEKASIIHTHNYAGASTSGGAATSAIKLNASKEIDGVKFDGSAAIVHYGVCSTPAASAAKTVDCTGFTLVTGAKIAIKFSNTNIANTPTLNVNGTGAKNIYYRGAAVDKNLFSADRVYEFVYDGTQYQFIGDINVNTTYTGSDGITLTDTNFTNSGVRNITTGTANGTISVNTNGNVAEVSVAGLQSGAYTDAYTHPTTAGNKHIPTGGSSGQILKYGGSSGTATWANEYSYTHPTSGVTEGSYGPTANVSGTNNTTINVPQLTVDTNGHVTEVVNRVYTSKDTTYEAMSAAEATTGTATTARTITAKVLHDKIKAVADTSAASIDTGVMSITSGSANGTLSVDGTDVAVTGLQSGAYAAAYTHPTTAGNKHIPSGGSSGQILKYSADGTATWATLTASDVGALPSNTDIGVLSVTEGATNGTLSVDGIDTPVHGLKSGAYAAAYTHPTTAGNKHIPSGGSSGQILKWSADGTAVWAAEYSYTHPTTAGNKHIPANGATNQVLVYGGSSGTATWGAVPSHTHSGEYTPYAASVGSNQKFVYTNSSGALTAANFEIWVTDDT